MSEKGRLVVVSGFSGAGKGTLMKALMEQYGNDYALSVSATTRNPRPGERDGIDYFFVTTEKFEQMIEADELIEYAQYVNNYYGTPKAYVQQQLDLGKNVILEIEIQGAMNQGTIPGYDPYVCYGSGCVHAPRSSCRTRNRDEGRDPCKACARL